ncbi:MAG: hypothetical protein WAQ24_03390 [Candidatus Saccharimonadales bacterium]
MKPQEKTYIVVGTTAVILAAGLGGGWLFLKPNRAQSSISAQPTNTAVATPVASAQANLQSTAPASTATTSATSSGYKDGQYTASTSYDVPHGSNSLSVNLTLADGKVTAVKVNNTYGDRESALYIDSFQGELRSTVVGKAIASLSPSRIGGATLTTDAFAQALDSIARQAKA